MTGYYDPCPSTIASLAEYYLLDEILHFIHSVLECIDYKSSAGPGRITEQKTWFYEVVLISSHCD